MYHLAFCGFRIGELLGMRIIDVDLIQKTVRVTQSAVALDGGKMQIETPKTDNAYRTLPLTPRLVTVLRRRLEMLLIERGREDWQENGLLFPSERGTIMLYSNADRHLSDSVLPMAGITRPFSWHKFRHTVVTWLTDLGTTNEIIRSIVGHSDRNVTDRYRQGVSLDVKRATLEAMEERWLQSEYTPSEEQVGDRAWSRRSGHGEKQKQG